MFEGVKEFFSSIFNGFSFLRDMADKGDIEYADEDPDGFPLSELPDHLQVANPKEP